MKTLLLALALLTASPVLADPVPTVVVASPVTSGPSGVMIGRVPDDMSGDLPICDGPSDLVIGGPNTVQITPMPDPTKSDFGDPSAPASSSPAAPAGS